MPYHSDYVMRLIEQLSALVRQTLERLGAREAEEPEDLAGQAIGLVLGMDPALGSRLAPESLSSLLELGNVDPKVSVLLARAIEIEAETAATRGDEALLRLRRAQAEAVRSLVGGAASEAYTG